MHGNSCLAGIFFVFQWLCANHPVTLLRFGSRYVTAKESSIMQDSIKQLLKQGKKRRIISKNQTMKMYEWRYASTYS